MGAGGRVRTTWRSWTTLAALVALAVCVWLVLRDDVASPAVDVSATAPPAGDRRVVLGREPADTAAPPATSPVASEREPAAVPVAERVRLRVECLAPDDSPLEGAEVVLGPAPGSRATKAHITRTTISGGLGIAALGEVHADGSHMVGFARQGLARGGAGDLAWLGEWALDPVAFAARRHVPGDLVAAVPWGSTPGEPHAAVLVDGPYVRIKQRSGLPLDLRIEPLRRRQLDARPRISVQPSLQRATPPVATPRVLWTTLEAGQTDAVLVIDRHYRMSGAHQMLQRSTCAVPCIAPTTKHLVAHVPEWPEAALFVLAADWHVSPGPLPLDGVRLDGQPVEGARAWATDGSVRIRGVPHCPGARLEAQLTVEGKVRLVVPVHLPLDLDEKLYLSLGDAESAGGATREEAGPSPASEGERGAEGLDVTAQRGTEASPPRLPLARSDKLVVGVVDERGKSMPFALLAIRFAEGWPWLDVRGDRQRIDLHVSEGGRRELHGLPVGRVEVSARVGSLFEGRGEVELSPGGTARLVITVRPREDAASGR